MYVVASYFIVKRERRAKFIAAAHEDGRNSIADPQEPGTQRFEVIEDEDRPNRFVLNEAYGDAEAFKTHVDGTHYADFFELIEDCVVDGPISLIKGDRVEDPDS